MSVTQTIAITAGEPAGIGPDLCIQVAQKAQSQKLVVIADPEMLKQRAEQLSLPLTIKLFDPDAPCTLSQPGELVVLPLKTTNQVIPGKLNANNAQYVLDSLQTAINGIQKGWFSAMVTAPVHKGIINEAGITFSGHTEFLQEKTRCNEVVMMLATEGLRVALVTTHLPLAAIPKAITREKILSIGTILYRDLQQKFGIENPRILVCGLNPHAGEDGHMGREEIDTITPALQLLEQQGMRFIGPLPADTLFTDHLLKDADAVLAMYHDQGLPVLKYKGFGKAVNITLGLPIIRTSVDHGTALDLAGTGRAEVGSLETAIDTAVEMATAKANTALAN